MLEAIARLRRLQKNIERIGITRRRRVTNDVDGIAMRPGRRKNPVQFRDCLGPEFRQPSAGIDKRVGREHARPTPIGENDEFAAFDGGGARQRFDGIEHLFEIAHTQNTGPPERRVVHRIDARERPRMGACRLGRFQVAARLDRDDGLEARRRPRRRKELARRSDRFDVKKNRLGIGIGREIIQHIAEIHIGHAAERNQMRKSDAARRCPIEHRGHDGPRLGHEGNASAGDVSGREGGIQLHFGGQHAQAIRPDDPQ
jgi:hypothetical protein